MRIYEILQESVSKQKMLSDAVEAWVEEGYKHYYDNGFDKNPALTRRQRRLSILYSNIDLLEKMIIDLSGVAGTLPTYTGNLYRGTGLPDNDFSSIIAGKPITITGNPSRRITSWTKNKKIAIDFAQMAIDEYFSEKPSSAMVIEMPSHSLNLLIDVDEILGRSEFESEIIVLNKPFLIKPQNVVVIYPSSNLRDVNNLPKEIIL